MTRLMEFTRIEWVECVPKTIEEGVLYISEKYQGMEHLCPCGCGVNIFIPWREYPCSDLYWEMKKNEDETVSFEPSMLNRIPCKSHYFIRRNKVEWC